MTNSPAPAEPTPGGGDAPSPVTWQPETPELPDAPTDWPRIRFALARGALTVLTGGWVIWALPMAWTRVEILEYPPLLCWFFLLCGALALLLYAPYSPSLRLRLMAEGGAFFVPFVVISRHYFSSRSPYVLMLLIQASSLSLGVAMVRMEFSFVKKAVGPDGSPLVMSAPNSQLTTREIVLRRWFAGCPIPLAGLFFSWYYLGFWIHVGYEQWVLRGLLTTGVILILFGCGVGMRRAFPRLMLYGASLAHCMLYSIEVVYRLTVALFGIPPVYRRTDLPYYLVEQFGLLTAMVCCGWLLWHNLPLEIPLLLQSAAAGGSDSEELEATPNWDEGAKKAEGANR